MKAIWNEFFGIGGYSRPIEGFMSWQHLTFVSALVAVMITLAVWLGRKNRKRTEKEKNRVLIAAAILLDGLEILKIVLNTIQSGDPFYWRYELPLFLCSIQLITVPLAAFSKGRLREAALDFVCIFGILGALLGTYGAGNIYSSAPVISFGNVISGITHCISGFASLYILFARMCSMKKRNIPITFGILLFFCLSALLCNEVVGYNYMFLRRGDGTPYDILYNIVKGDKVLYPLGVILLFLVYIVLYYGIYFRITGKKQGEMEGKNQKTAKKFANETFDL